MTAVLTDSCGSTTTGKQEFDLSGIVNSICPICNKNCATKTKVCEHFQEEHIENISNEKDQPLSELLTPAAKKSLQDNDIEDIVWNNKNVDELLDKFEAQLKASECSDSDDE